MSTNNITSDEFDWLFEIVIAILFMSFGVFAISRMILQLDAQTEVTSRVDKVRVTEEYMEANEKLFEFTGYQAFMFSYMMDIYSPADLYYMQSQNAVTKATADGKLLTYYYPTDGNGKLDMDNIDKRYIGMMRNSSDLGDTEAWQTLITGQSKAYRNVNVASIVNQASVGLIKETSDRDKALNKEKKISMFRGTDNQPKWKLEFGIDHVGVETRETLGTAIIEERKDYIWTLAPN